MTTKNTKRRPSKLNDYRFLLHRADMTYDRELSFLVNVVVTSSRTPGRRLSTIRALAEAGHDVGVMQHCMDMVRIAGRAVGWRTLDDAALALRVAALPADVDLKVCQGCKDGRGSRWLGGELETCTECGGCGRDLVDADYQIQSAKEAEIAREAETSGRDPFAKTPGCCGRGIFPCRLAPEHGGFCNPLTDAEYAARVAS